MTGARLTRRGRALVRVARAVAALLTSVVAGALLCLVYVAGDQARCQALVAQHSPTAVRYCPPADLQETRR